MLAQAVLCTVSAKGKETKEFAHLCTLCIHEDVWSWYGLL